MVKKSLCFLLIIAFLTIFAALLWTVFRSTGSIDLRANFSKSIPVASSAAALLGRRLGQRLEDLTFQGLKSDLDSGRITSISYCFEIEGSYAVTYESDYAQLTITGEPIIIKNLPLMQVHQVTHPILSKPTDHDLLKSDSYQASKVELLKAQINDEELPFFSVVVLGPVKFITDKHQGKLSLDDQATHSTKMGSPTVSLSDFKKQATTYVPVHGVLLPSDIPSQRYFLMPMNNFRITVTSTSGETTISQVFLGQLMRLTDFHFISSRRSFSSMLDAKATDLIDHALGVPCKVTVVGDSINSMTLSGFNGELKDLRCGKTWQESNAEWHLSGIKSSSIIAEISPNDSRHVFVRLDFRGKVMNLIVDKKNLLGFASQFTNNLFSIWANPYLVGIIGVVYTVLILKWIKSESA